MSVLNKSKKFIQSFQKNTSPDCVNFRVDYLRLNFPDYLPFFEKIINRIDFDNNCDEYSEDLKLNYKKTKTRNGVCISAVYSYNGLSVPLYQYQKLDGNLLNVDSKCRIDIYGSFYRLIDIGELPKNYDKWLISGWSMGFDSSVNITRIDYHLDLFYNKKIKFPPLSSYGVLDSRTKSIQWNRGDKKNGTYRIESREIGTTKDSQSSRYLIRMYDKQLQVSTNKKWILYDDYFKYKSVFRFEIEFGSSFCRGYTFSRYDELLEKVKYYFGLNDFKSKAFYSYDKSKIFTESKKIFYIDQFTKKALVLLEAGINPYSLVDSRCGKENPYIQNLNNIAKNSFITENQNDEIN